MIHPILAPRRRWPVFVPLALVLALGGIWSGFWYYAASTVEAQIVEWRAREARLGRIHACARQSIGGYPFRIEFRCVNATAELRETQPPLFVRAKDLLFVAQIYDPSLLIGELTGPVTISEPTQVLLSGNWTLGQMSLRGLPSSLDRLSMVFEDLKLNRPRNGVVMNADRFELHARVSEGAPANNPVLEIVGRANGAVIPATGPLSNNPGDIEIDGVLRGLNSLSPKPIAVLLRELQSTGGKLEVTRARIQQGDIIAVSSGTLSLSRNARLEGQLRVTATGVEQLVKVLGLDQALVASAGPRGNAYGHDRADRIANALERIMPGATGAQRAKAAEAGLQMGLALLGERAELEGKRATTMPLRFTDGIATLGPIKLGQVPPLY